MDDKTRELYAAIGRGEIVQFSGDTQWIDWGDEYGLLLGRTGHKWRIKKKTIRVNGVEVPAPLDVLPESGTVFVVCLHEDSGAWDVEVVNSDLLRPLIAVGIVHSTEANAALHAKAMLIREPA